MSAVPRLREYRGPALFSYGFRPFFLLGAIHAAIAIPLWLLAFWGVIPVGSAFGARDWHVHEMLYGYVPAVMTGFLLTAIPNWTGRLPLQGTPLQILVVAWLAGRVVVAVSAWTGWIVAAAVDTSFLFLLLASVIREVTAGRNWRNLKIAVLLGLLALGNLAFHLEARIEGAADVSIRLGLAVVVTLIMVIGGRIVPNFTRGWLSRERPGRLPQPFGRFDVACIVVSVAALVLWIAFPFAEATGLALVAGGLAQLARLVRWAGDRTVGERLVLILHLGYAFVPLGFLLLGAAAFDIGTASAGLHAWATGAVGVMTLAVMTRASLGHTGQVLTAATATQVIYAAILVAAIARICAALEPERMTVLLTVSGSAWIAAFAGFALAYGPSLCRQPKSAERGC